jgi:hypothetical protein
MLEVMLHISTHNNVERIFIDFPTMLKSIKLLKQCRAYDGARVKGNGTRQQIIQHTEL